MKLLYIAKCINELLLTFKGNNESHIESEVYTIKIHLTEFLKFKSGVFIPNILLK